METLVLILVLHVVVVGALVVGRALHAKLGPVVVPAAEAGAGQSFQTGHPFALPAGRSLEEYAQAGLVDLRIMLVQAARRRDD